MISKVESAIDSLEQFGLRNSVRISGIPEELNENISICHECEDGIEKSVPRITDWHHEACRVMTNGDHEGQNFLYHPHTNNGFFFLLTT